MRRRLRSNLPRGDEYQPFQMVGHEGLPFRDPDAAQVSNILALLLKRLQVFFMCQSEATQNPPDGAAMNVDTVGLGQFGDQLIERDPALGGDARINPAGHSGQLAVPAAIALRPRQKRPCFAPQFDQFVHESR